MLLGQHCPDAARGRPALRPLFAYAGRGWHDDEGLLSRIVDAGVVRQLSVLGWDGRRVGVMSALGAATESGESFVIGSYAGSPPCAEKAPLTEAPERDPACLRALGGCGVAIATLEEPAGRGARPFGEDAAPAELSTKGACVRDGELVVDLDGRGKEGFPLAGFAGGEAPAELVASGGEPPSCEPSFALEARIEGVRIDVLAVADLDDSGRAEVLVATGDGALRRWTLYSARSTPARLDRVGTARVPHGNRREP